MTAPRADFQIAATDFRYLLSRGYSRPAALALVGDRYQLDHTARQILHRGVFAPEVAQARRAKLRLLRDLPGQPLGIDGHNVLSAPSPNPPQSLKVLCRARPTPHSFPILP
ncbi:MAG: hypothetical protein A2Y80_08775 [Deltaproteobacteria bacterium RBG_13_58_19]|nr:MAG: hypothetical protein A2Y80_08775 [Deltaproteobacteria bacterium RBG_13_58_19]